MEALVGQEAQFVSNPVRKAEPVKLSRMAAATDARAGS